MEMEMVYKEEKTKELNFRYNSVPTPPTICPYCHGLGYQETGEDTYECKICKGTGRSNS